MSFPFPFLALAETFCVNCGCIALDEPTGKSELSFENIDLLLWLRRLTNFFRRSESGLQQQTRFSHCDSTNCRPAIATTELPADHDYT